MKRVVSLVGVLFMSFPLQAQQDPLRPFVPPDAEIKLGTVLTGQLLVGRTDAWPGAPDISAGSRRRPAMSAIRSRMAPRSATQGVSCSGTSATRPIWGCDAPARTNANYNAAPAPVASDTYLGGLYWQVWGGRCEPGHNGYGAGAAAMGGMRSSTRAASAFKRARHALAACTWRQRRSGTTAVRKIAWCSARMDA